MIAQKANSWLASVSAPLPSAALFSPSSGEEPRTPFKAHTKKHQASPQALKIRQRRVRYTSFTFADAALQVGLFLDAVTKAF